MAREFDRPNAQIYLPKMWIHNQPNRRPRWQGIQDRVTMLPEAVRHELQQHTQRLKRFHRLELEAVGRLSSGVSFVRATGNAISLTRYCMLAKAGCRIVGSPSRFDALGTSESQR